MQGSFCTKRTISSNPLPIDLEIKRTTRRNLFDTKRLENLVQQEISQFYSQSQQIFQDVEMTKTNQA